MNKKRHGWKPSKERAKQYRSSWSAEDRQTVGRATSVGLFCLVNREKKREPLYIFYDRTTGKELSSCWKASDAVSAMNQAINIRRERSGMPAFNPNCKDASTHGK